LWEDVGVGRSSVVRGIRGAINVSKNSTPEILQATRELLVKMAKANHVKKEDIASIFFTLTPDLNAAYPAAAARELGWVYVPLLCAVEIDVAEALPLTIRVLMHVNTELSQNDVKHIYLRDARLLRADLISNNT
jgi:chorismate mutase